MAQTDIVIVGAGPAGMAAALALADGGWTVSLAGPPANTGDLRTTAVMITTTFHCYNSHHYAYDKSKLKTQQTNI